VPLRVQGLPLIKPPYGRITAYDLSKGAIAWQVAHGETPDEIRNHPMLKGLDIPRTGRPGFIGTLVTKTLIIAGEAGQFTTPNGQRGAMLRAYDKMTGREVGSVYMPAPQTGSPMTYRREGRQYLIVAIGSAQYGAEFVAFRLPTPPAGRGGAAGHNRRDEVLETVASPADRKQPVRGHLRYSLGGCVSQKRVPAAGCS
jgi:quinoprotein glucose dehydrogenase